MNVYNALYNKSWGKAYESALQTSSRASKLDSGDAHIIDAVSRVQVVSLVLEDHRPVHAALLKRVADTLLLRYVAPEQF